MKILFKLFLAALLFFGLDRLVRTQTNGFRIDKTTSPYTASPEWDFPAPSQHEQLLNQEFFFIGSGAQFYAFMGKDQKTVLKLYKHYHMWPGNQILVRMPFTKKWKEKVIAERKKRNFYSYASTLLAAGPLADLTGVIYLNINPRLNYYPQVTLYDKIGIKYQIDLNNRPFVLQKRATTLFTYLKKHPEKIKEMIDSLFEHIHQCASLNIMNNDPILYCNYGVIDDKLTQIDIGSFVKNPFVKNSLIEKRELYFQSLQMREWITKKHPELLTYFEKRLNETISQDSPLFDSSDQP